MKLGVHARDYGIMMAFASRRSVLTGLVAAAGAATGSTTRAGRAEERSVDVADGRQLAAALATAAPGDRIRLAEGSYRIGEPFVVATSGTAHSPVRIEAVAPSTAVLVDPIILSGAHITLAGVAISGATSIVQGDAVRITRCRFENNPEMALLIAAGRGVRIDHCAFARCRGRGISVKPTQAMTGLRIDHNHFFGFLGAQGENAHEAIQLGQGMSHAAVALNSLIEYNLLDDVSIDSECISVKSSNNTIQLNTLINSTSRITNRFGKHNRYIANWTEDAFGLLIRDEGHQLINNRIIGNGNGHGLRICAGNVDTDLANLRKPDGKLGQPCAKNVLLAGNEAHTSVIGFAFDGHTIPATGTRIQAHQGPIAYAVEEDTVIEPHTALRGPRAVKLLPSDVGPLVPRDD